MERCELSQLRMQNPQGRDVGDEGEWAPRIQALATGLMHLCQQKISGKEHVWIRCTACFSWQEDSGAQCIQHNPLKLLKRGKESREVGQLTAVILQWTLEQKQLLWPFCNTRGHTADRLERQPSREVFCGSPGNLILTCLINGHFKGNYLLTGTTLISESPYFLTP